jgi:hypothetical protein
MGLWGVTLAIVETSQNKSYMQGLIDIRGPSPTGLQGKVLAIIETSLHMNFWGGLGND